MSLHTFDIPRADWTAALAEFSRMHASWLVSVEVLTPGMGSQPEIADMALTGLTFEPGNGGAIVITAGREADAHVAHVVGAPTNVRIARTESGADAALEIESTDGTRTILRFRTAALPETVDGLAHLA